jgi:hypothetical protein
LILILIDFALDMISSVDSLNSYSKAKHFHRYNRTTRYQNRKQVCAVLWVLTSEQVKSCRDNNKKAVVDLIQLVNQHLNEHNPQLDDILHELNVAVSSTWNPSRD